MIAPAFDLNRGFLQAVEDLPVQELVAELCSDMAASLRAAANALPWDIDTSICRSLDTICSTPWRFIPMPLPSKIVVQFVTSSYNNWYHYSGLGQRLGVTLN